MKKSVLVTIVVCLLLPVFAATAATIIDIDAGALNTWSQVATSQWGGSLPGYSSLVLMIVALIALRAVRRK